MEAIAYSLDAIQGLGDFDRPGGTVQAAAKLMIRLNMEKRFFTLDLSVLIHEPSQGHFPVWLLKYLEQKHPGFLPYSLGLSGRNILALEASRHRRKP
jgi:hypothetical protein